MNPDGASQHPEPFWFFVPFLIGSLILWIPLLPAVIAGYQKHAQAGPLIRFAGFWSLGPFLFFSASSGKLGTYILPCFPALAILIGIGLNRYLASPKRTLFSAGAVTSGAVALAGTAFLLIHELGNPPSVRWYGDGELWKWIVASITLALWGSLCLFSAARARNTAGIWLFCSAPVLFMFSVNFIIPAKSVDHRAPGTFIMAHAKEIPPEAQVFANAGLVPAVSWYLGENDLRL